MAIEIESVIRELAKKNHINFGSTMKLANELSEKKVINEEILPIFKDFWNIRNMVVHGLHEKINENTIYELTYLGFRILNLLLLSKDKT